MDEQLHLTILCEICYLSIPYIYLSIYPFIYPFHTFNIVFPRI